MIQPQKVYYPLYLDKDKFIILVTGGRGCEAPDTKIMMADLTVKKIKDIKIGDKVMGDDGKPRNVLDTMHGYSEMYHIHQTSGEDYTVNDAHILTLKKSQAAINDKGELTKEGTYRRPNGRYPQYEEVSDINVLSYKAQSKHFRENFRGFKIDSIPYPKQDVLIEPYLLGLWLGDGTAVHPRITNPEEEIRKYLEDYCNENKQKFSCIYKQGAYHIGIVGDRKQGNNHFLNNLKFYDLIDNKHIPQEYISNSEEVRLELLAGLLDTDGHMERNGYEIIQKNKELSYGIKFIADSLGFRTSISEKEAKIKGKSYGIVYRVFINGDVWRIPCKVERKKVHENMCHKNKDWHLSYIDITPAGLGEWNGICLDGNQRYVHSDGTVTHNSGKSFNVSTFIKRLTYETGKLNGSKVSHQILYTRYTMTSANISIIPEFLEKMELDGDSKYFKTTKTDVINRRSGSHIMFRGIKTSSGNQTAKLKSIYGITVFVCDEGEEWTDEQSFDTMMYSIRQKGIRNLIIIIMNPTDSNHFVYRKFLKDTHKIEYFDGVPVQISTHPNVLHIHTSYLDNKENLSKDFLEAAEKVKEENPEKYAHVFMGQWADVREGAIFKKWGVVKELPSNITKVAIGLDFGFTHDPSAMVLCGVRDNDLFVQELCYKTGMLNADLIRECKKYNLKVIADSADPRLIQEIANAGILIYPVEKGAGSIIAGIEKIKDMNLFVTEDSFNLQNELRNYVWDTNKDGHYINQPADGQADHCMDSLRYYVNGILLGKIQKPKDLTGIFH